MRISSASGIYAITNVGNGKVYVGSTTNFKRRWAWHKRYLRGGYHDNLHLQAAWNKYGEATFEFGILEYLDNPEELHLAEQFWMDVYREEGSELYNFGLAARNPMLGRKHTEETRRKLSEAHKGHRHSAETRRKISKAGKGRKHTEEARRKMSDANRGRRLTEETRRKIGEANAKPYPAFIHKDTGEVIPAGVNLAEMCRERGLVHQLIDAVKHGKRHSHHGWILFEKGERK